MKIYISGKIAGDPDYKGKFARAAAQLERLGATVINPATAPEGLTKLDYMRICFAEMEAVDYVVFLPDWVESAGAKLERAWCDYVGVPAVSWDSFLKSMQGIKNAGCGYSFRDLLTREHPEEIADVEIMLEQMKMLFCCADDVRDVRRRKVERLKERLDNGT